MGASCHHDPPRPDECHLCWLWENDPRYRLNWGGDSRDIIVPVRKKAAPETTEKSDEHVASVRQPPGPGTKLKQLISELGVFSVEGCGCQSLASDMDRHGPQWCLENIGSIVDLIEQRINDRGLGLLLLTSLKTSPLETIKLAFGGLTVRGVIEKMVREACSE